jgi:hypothetical protein
MSGKSKEEIAFEILSKLKGVGIWGENNQEAILDMYAKCLEATSGLREIDGKKPVALRMPTQAPVAAPAVQAPSVAPQQVARAPHPAQNQVPAAFQAPPQQQATPVQQQQRVQQAYQQQTPPR